MDIQSVCYACGSSRVSRATWHLRTIQDLEIRICDQCGHAQRMIEPNLVQQEQHETSGSRETLPNPVLARWPRRHAMVARPIKKYKRSGRAIDVGCSNGQWFLSLGQEWERHGVELSPKLADIAEKYTHATVFRGLIEDYSAPEKSFDLVTAFAVIEHMSDPRLLVKKAHEILVPGGMLVIMTGDRESVVAQEMGQEWPLYSSTDHVHYFSARSLDLLLKSGGFNTVRQDWRFMYGSGKHRRPWLGVHSKLKEILGLTHSSVWDHHYSYSIKAP